MDSGGFGGEMNQSAPTPAALAAGNAVTALPRGGLAELPNPPTGSITPASELARRVLAYDPKADTRLIETAYELAEKAHSTQRRENGDPYFMHPVAVAEILIGYRLDVASIVTALLHDVVEDTTYKLSEIEKIFGKEIAVLVDGVTKLTRLELQSDRTKQAENFRKLVLAMSRDIRVLLVKLADRLHNMRTIGFVRTPEKRKRVARETMDIYAPLAERIGMDTVKTELQTMSFRQLEPEAYDTIMARLNFLRGQGADVIDEVRRELIAICREAGVEPIEITGREKSPFSIWEKMHRRNVTFEQLSDIMAFRIVVQSKSDCYAALGAVHSAYPVIAGRFKDYISTPKSNGYQSLHTGVTLRQPRNQKIEVQIRTEEMNDVAENGVASHWLYKAPDKKNVDGADVHKFRWVQDLLEILEDSAAPDEFLENTKLELYADQVFCFTPKGQLIQLPRGATPVDFAYAVHSQVGDTCVGAKVNGRLMPLRHHLQNGDQVEIMTARGGTPSPQWERFVVTGKARARIRRFVHQEQRQQSRDAGKVELTKAFRQAGVDGSEKALEPALKALKLATVDDLYIAVGNNNLGARDVVNAAYPELRQAARGPRMVPQMLARGRPAPRPSDDMPVTGLVAGMAYNFAGCCHPVPGDEIVGIVTTGKGVTIHNRDCQTLHGFAATPERFIDVDWNYEAVGKSGPSKGVGHTARITVIASNEGGSLADLTNAIAKQDGAISNLKIVSRQLDFMEILADVDVRDINHLSKVVVGLRGLKSVKSVERATGA